MDKAWDLILGDCIAGMADLPDQSVDHVITDPPYAPRAMKNATTQSMVQRRDGKEYDFGYAALSDELRKAAAQQIVRIVRRWIEVWCDIESTGAWKQELEAAGARYIRTGVWVRTNGCPQFSGDRPAQGVEGCVIAHAPDGRLRWNGGGRPAVWTGPIVNSQSGERIHSSPKPEWLMMAQIRDFTEPGELVCDPFAGSATTGFAAITEGRRFIGWECSPQYHASATKRLQDAQKQESLFRVSPVAQVKLNLG